MRQGAPVDPAAQHDQQQRTDFVTAGGVRVTRTAVPFSPSALATICAEVDGRRGGVLSSGMEYPGRYSRWHMAYVDPCAEIVASGRRISVRALNARGEVLLPVLIPALLRAGTPVAAGASLPPAGVEVIVPEPAGLVAEEDRSRRPTVFSALREVIAAFASGDPHLGLYGAFGYDLAFQFEPVTLRHDRPDDQRDLVLHLHDELYVLDRKREEAIRYRYEFAVGGASTEGLPRDTPPPPPPRPARPAEGSGRRGGVVADDCAGAVPGPPVPGSYARIVEQARERFARGDLFEVVPSHVFHGPCASPAAVYERLGEGNPAPYGVLVNRRVLNSRKEEPELTMCTDVDRNDKSRVGAPGSVRVIGRRQIEMYSRLIHTVDHIEGRLRPGLDALDAFLSHMWAVTVTGAPKTWAMQFIEDHEGGPRRWYGGAVGRIGFDGSMNTGLTLRTAHITGGIAAVRAGATLLYDSVPEAEEKETQIKARALLETLEEAIRLAQGGPDPDDPAAITAADGTVLAAGAI